MTCLKSGRNITSNPRAHDEWTMLEVSAALKSSVKLGRKGKYVKTIYSPDVAQFGRAPALGAGCRMFKSCHLDQ